MGDMAFQRVLYNSPRAGSCLHRASEIGTGFEGFVMNDLETITSKMSSRLAGNGIGGSVKFDFGAEGCILVDGDGNVSNDDGEADCTIGVEMNDFKEIAAGNLDPTMAFMQGKLKVDGEMGLAMKMGPLLAG